MSLAWCKKQKTEPVTSGRNLTTSKTAQLSAFILLGVVVILVLGAAMVLLSGLSSSSYKSSSLSPQNFIDACYKKAVECALAENSRQSLPLQPEALLQAASDDTKQNAITCFNDFNDFKGMTITAADITPELHADDTGISVTVTHDIKQNENGKTKSLNNYHARLPARLKKIAELTQRLPSTGYIKLSDGIDKVDVTVCNGPLSPVILYTDRKPESQGSPYVMMVDWP